MVDHGADTDDIIGSQLGEHGQGNDFPGTGLGNGENVGMNAATSGLRMN
jgi:hypothetical protein